MHLFDLSLHLLHNLLTLTENALFLVEFLPRQLIHTLNTAPRRLHLLLELVDAWCDLSQDVLCFRFDVQLHLLQLLT
jgi:hypothetical protein